MFAPHHADHRLRRACGQRVEEAIRIFLALCLPLFLHHPDWLLLLADFAPRDRFWLGNCCPASNGESGKSVAMDGSLLFAAVLRPPRYLGLDHGEGKPGDRPSSERQAELFRAAFRIDCRSFFLDPGRYLLCVLQLCGALFPPYFSPPGQRRRSEVVDSDAGSFFSGSSRFCGLHDIRRL